MEIKKKHQENREKKCSIHKHTKSAMLWICSWKVTKIRQKSYPRCRMSLFVKHSTAQGFSPPLSLNVEQIATCCSVRTGEVHDNLVKIRARADWIVFCCYFGDLFGLAYSVLALFMSCSERKWHVVALFWLDANVSSRWGITQRGLYDR